jgi:ubiquitin-protein ligase
MSARGGGGNHRALLHEWFSARSVLDASLSCQSLHGKLLSHVEIELADPSDLSVWVVCFHGLAQTCLAGGTFYAEMRFPTEFPHKSPVVRFLTPMFHPNIDEYGHVSVSYNYRHGSHGGFNGVCSFLVGLLLFLDDPCPFEALNLEAAALRMHDRHAYLDRVASHTAKHAHGGPPSSYHSSLSSYFPTPSVCGHSLPSPSLAFASASVSMHMQNANDWAPFGNDAPHQFFGEQKGQGLVHLVEQRPVGVQSQLKRKRRKEDKANPRSDEGRQHFKSSFKRVKRVTHALNEQ